MTRTLLIAALLLSPTAALAETTVSHTNCRTNFYSGTTCTSSVSTPSSRHYADDQLTKQEIAELNRESDERYNKWRAFCKPVGNVDRYGVTRLSYAHRGCEFGRTE